MQYHPNPSAHVCTLLPPGNLPMRDKHPALDQPTRLTFTSECGRVRRSFSRAFDDSYSVPVGTWRAFGKRTDDAGEKWTKQTWGVHYVVDDFGFLALAGRGGAA